jgi:hypothetical protein
MDLGAPCRDGAVRADRARVTDALAAGATPVTSTSASAAAVR